MKKILNVNELEKILKTIPPLSYSELVYKKISSIETITIPEGYEEIEHQTFCNIKGLKVVNLPSTLKTIHWYAFGNCEDLKQINCLSPLVSVEAEAFSWCQNLKAINMTMDISEEEGLLGLFNISPKSLEIFRLGKMVDGKVVSKNYKSCEFTPLPNEIRIPEDDEEYKEDRHQYIAINEEENH